MRTGTVERRAGTVGRTGTTSGGWYDWTICADGRGLLCWCGAGVLYFSETGVCCLQREVWKERINIPIHTKNSIPGHATPGNSVSFKRYFIRRIKLLNTGGDAPFENTKNKWNTRFTRYVIVYTIIRSTWMLTRFSWWISFCLSWVRLSRFFLLIVLSSISPNQPMWWLLAVLACLVCWFSGDWG